MSYVDSPLFFKIAVLAPDRLRGGICDHLQSYHVSIGYSAPFSMDCFFSIIESNDYDYILIDISESIYSNDTNRFEIINSLHNQFDIEPNKIMVVANYFNEQNDRIMSVSNELKKVYTDLTFTHPGIRTIPMPSTIADDSEMIEAINAGVDVILSQDFSIILSDFSTDVFIEDNVLSATIILGSSLSKYEESCFKYRFFIIKDSEVIFKTNPMNSNSVSLPLEHSGSYVVQSYVHCDKHHVFVRSDARFYATDSFLKSYNDYISTRAEDELLFNIYDTKEPFYDFLITRNLNITNIATLLDEYGITNSTKISDCDIFSNGIKIKDDNVVIFSGITKINGTIYTGQFPASFEDLFNLTEKTGSYTMVRFSKASGLISNDLMGYGKIWFYSNGNSFAISNRYSLLIKLLKLCNINLKLDYEQIKVILSSMTNYFLHNHFSNVMDVKEISMLSIDRDISITADGIKLIPNEVFSILTDSTILDYESYNQLLDASIDEVADNLSAAFKYGISNKILQLTGGMDSRAILSVMTNLSIPDDLHLSTRGKKEDGDVIISAKLSELTNMDYDTSIDIRYMMSFTEAFDLCREHNMGLIYSHKLNPYVSDKQTLIISGGTGDAICRSEYSRHFMGGFAGYPKNIHELSIAWRSWISMSKLYGDFDGNTNSLSVLCQTMDTIPVHSPLEKIDRMYMFFRSRFHFDPYLEYVANSVIWMPLSCCSMLRLNHLTHDAFRGIKLETDVIEKANPVLLKVPFEKLQDNIDCEINHMVYNNLPMWVNKIQSITNDGISKWINQQTIRKTTNCRDLLFNQKDLYFKLSYNKLKFIAQNCDQLSSICPALYHYMMNNCNNEGRMITMCNKLSSVIDQFNLIR